MASNGARFSVHPLFLLFGLVETIRGRLFSFLSVTIVALLHELGHSLYAESIGFRLDKLVLMPYGACVSGDIEGMTRKEKVLLYLAGPLTNGLICLVFVALWWLIPESYPYTEEAVIASMTVGLVNLIPALPLDGGRVLSCFLKKHIKWVSLVFSVGFLLIGFLLTNLSMVFFGLFLLFGKEGRYERIPMEIDLKHGARREEILISSRAKLRSLFRHLERGKVVTFLVMERGKEIGRIEQREVYEICLKYNNSCSLRQILLKNDLQNVPLNGIIGNNECET